MDRLAAQAEKKSDIDSFKERSREWYLRKGRESQDRLSHKDISQKYREAFKNLSQELKRKIDTEYSRGGHESIDNRYLQCSSTGTELMRKMRPGVEEDQ